MESAIRVVKSKRVGYRQLALTINVAAAMALIALQLAGQWISPVNAGLVEVLLVVLTAATYGFWAGLLVASLSAIVFNYFFLAPIFGFGLSDPQHLAVVPVFYVSALLGVSLRPEQPPAENAYLSQQETPAPVAATMQHEVEAINESEPVRSFSLVDNQLLVDGLEVRLTPTELSLLRLFMNNPGRVLTRETILTTVWGAEYVGDVRILRTYINQLRTKLHDNAAAPHFIRTEPGYGYRFVGLES